MKFVFFSFLFLSGCISTHQRLDPHAFYKRDMKIEVNDRKGEGVLVAKEAKEYKFEIESKGRLDLFTFTTCHREMTEEDAGEGGVFGNKKKVRFFYKPIEGIEDDGVCPVFLGGYEESKGRHSWAFIDFEGPEAVLGATVKCNGKQSSFDGVSVCQSKEGLIQEISFLVEARVARSGACKLSEQERGKVFQYEMKKGECVFVFLEVGGSGRIHRHSTIGYESILIRGK